MKNIGILLAIFCIPFGAHGEVGVLLDGTGRFAGNFEENLPYSPQRLDVDGDGIPEIVHKTQRDGDDYQAVDLSGVVKWSFTFDPSDLCPSCPTDDLWNVFFREFVNTEPSKRDAVMEFEYWNYDTQESYYFTGLVSASTGTLRQVISNRQFNGSMDLNGDSISELLFVPYWDNPLDGIWEVWGYSSAAGATEVMPRPSLDLMQNSPNPFNPSTQLQFTIHTPGRVRIEFFDLAGRFVDSEEMGFLEKGAHRYTWRGKSGDGRTLPSGEYFYSVVTAGERKSRKMMLLR